MLIRFFEFLRCAFLFKLILENSGRVSKSIARSLVYFNFLVSDFLRDIIIRERLARVNLIDHPVRSEKKQPNRIGLGRLPISRLKRNL